MISAPLNAAGLTMEGRPSAGTAFYQGFDEEAFEILLRLKQEPHIEQYRKETDGIDKHLKVPFRELRDEIAVRWVIPDALHLETEKNVFSRLLKNDFGAGGCNHHYWMAFYRPGKGRLTDIQLVQSLSPEGLDSGVYLGDSNMSLLRQVREKLSSHPDEFRSMLNALPEGFVFEVETVRSGKRTRIELPVPLEELPGETGRVKSIWVGRSLPRPRVVSAGSGVVDFCIGTLRLIWPIYQYFVSAPQ